MASALENVWGSIIHGTDLKSHASLSKNPIVKHAVGEECIHKLLLAGSFFSFTFKVQVMLLMNPICFCVYHTLQCNVIIIMWFVTEKLCTLFVMYTLRNGSHFEPICMYTSAYGCLSKTCTILWCGMKYLGCVYTETFSPEFVSKLLRFHVLFTRKL